MVRETYADGHSMELVRASYLNEPHLTKTLSLSLPRPLSLSPSVPLSLSPALSLLARVTTLNPKP